MDKDTVVEIMNKRGFRFSAESKGAGSGTGECYFLSEPLYGIPDNRIAVPAFGCTVYLESGEFKLTYTMPKSAIKLETPKCGTFMEFEDEKGFGSIRSEFEDAVQALYLALGKR